MTLAQRSAKFITNDLKKICREHGAPFPSAVPPEALRFALMLEEAEKITRRETREWIKEGLERDGFPYQPKVKK